jgi:AcrR family transcriptional regulator
MRSKTRVLKTETGPAESKSRPRRSQGERREAMQRVILEATVETMVRIGATSLRMEDVERQANISRGALLHYFRTKEDLLHATFVYINQRSLERSKERTKFVARSKGVADVIDAIVNDAIEFFFGQGFFVELALGFRSTQPCLRAAVVKMSRQSRFAVEKNWRGALVRHGLPDNIAGGVLNLTLNIVRGFALRRFMDDNPKQRAELTELWQEMVRCYLEKNLSSRDFAAVYPPARNVAEDAALHGGNISLISRASAGSTAPAGKRHLSARRRNC